MHTKCFIVIILLSSSLNTSFAIANSQSEPSARNSDIKAADVSNSSVESITPQDKQSPGNVDKASADNITPLIQTDNTGGPSTVPATTPDADSNNINKSDEPKQPEQSKDIEKPDSPAALPDNPPPQIAKNPLQEKVKTELDTIEKHRAAVMTLELQLLEITMPLSRLRVVCDKLKSVPFIKCSSAWILLSQMLYFKSFSYGSCKEAINMCEWVLRASQPYQTNAFGARAVMLKELLFLADLYERTGDRAKAEYCCQQFFARRSAAQVDINNVKVLDNSSGPDPQREALIKALTPSVNQIIAEHKSETFHLGSIDSLVYLVQAHLSYDKGDYIKSNEYLSKAKAAGLGFGKPLGQKHNTDTSRTKKNRKLRLSVVSL
jgi:hypothetical protein